MSLFPITVEVANSLLLSCELFASIDLKQQLPADTLPLFRRYYTWVRARTVRIPAGLSNSYVGWHSEHVNDRNVIHVWESSQVLEFLINYYNALERHIADTALSLSQLNVKSKPRDHDRTWIDICAEYEPVSSLGDHYAAYKRLTSDFIEPWKSRSGYRKNYSMLLYGPPGTGKTTLAENLAIELNLPMINISVSDFVGGGAAEIEARAKELFDILDAQRDYLILFDEIDQLLLDRDGGRYFNQQDVFQFMTPGMLTKLNDLRAGKRSLFVVATNYENPNRCCN